MKIIGLNGSPRTAWNTAQMVEKALDGAQSAGAEVKLYQLYNMDYKGCSSCFACKRLGSPGYGRCGMRDELSPVLDELLEADGVMLGSPVYFGDVTACVHALLERLWFAGLAYSSTKRQLYERRVPVRIFFTMNAPSGEFHKPLNESIVSMMTRLFGPAELIQATDTLQFDDYSKYETSMMNPESKIKRHNEVFPQDLQLAFDTGVRLVNMIKDGTAT